MIKSSVCVVLFSTYITVMLQFEEVEANSTQTCGDDENPCIRENFLHEQAFSEIVYNITEAAHTPNLKCKSKDLFFYYDESIEECNHCSNICSPPTSIICLESCEGYLVKVDADRKREELENRTTAELLRFKEKLLISEKSQEDLITISIVLAVASFCWALGLTVAVILCTRCNNIKMRGMKKSINKCEEYVSDPHPVTNSDDHHDAGLEHA